MAQLVVLLVTLLDSFNSVWTVILFVIQVSILRKYCANLNSWWTYASAFVWLLPLKCFNFPPERPVSHCCFSVRTVLRMFCTYSCLSPELRCRTTKHFELLDRSDWRYIEITLLTFLLEQLCHLWYPFGIIFMYCAFFSFCTLFILMLDAWRECIQRQWCLFSIFLRYLYRSALHISPGTQCTWRFSVSLNSSKERSQRKARSTRGCRETSPRKLLRQKYGKPTITCKEKWGGARGLFTLINAMKLHAI